MCIVLVLKRTLVFWQKDCKKVEMNMRCWRSNKNNTTLKGKFD